MLPIHFTQVVMAAMKASLDLHVHVAGNTLSEMGVWILQLHIMVTEFQDFPGMFQ